MNVRFTKAHGLGNDFILLCAADLRADTDLAALGRRLCDRRTGVGADGLILLCPPAVPGADVRMRIINSDGSEAQMCGNGIRCFAKYACERGLANAQMRIETLAGVREAVCDREGETVTEVTIAMGAPQWLSAGEERVRVLDREFAYMPLIMGVPHAVVPVEDPTDPALMRYGAAMEWAPPFPEGTNVDFIRVEDRQNILMRVWERGCGETFCCGTGATSAALCAHRLGLVEDTVRVHLRLGALTIRCTPAEAYMRGPAEFVYEGECIL